MEDLSELCRVCLVVPDESQLLDLNIVYDEEEELSYSDCFRICTNIDLNLGGNEMPHNLCKTCGLELQMAYDFYKKVEESKRYLNTEKCNSRQATTELQITQRFLECDEIKTENIIIESIINTSSPSKSSATPIEATETDDDEVNEELLDDLEEYHSVERLDDEECFWNTEILNQQSHADDIISTHTECKSEISKITIEREKLNRHKIVPVSAVSKESEDVTTRRLRRSLNKGPPFTCELCNHQSLSRSLLASHRHRKHRLKKSQGFHCHKCHKRFDTNKQLERHQRRATCQVYPELQCEYCEKILIGVANYNIHLRFHKKLYPYVCHLCAKSFMMAIHLNTHVKTKHENQRFICEHQNCGKMFQARHALKIHTYIHADTMPYKCEYCDRLYPTKGRLRWHIKKSHGIAHTQEELNGMLVAQNISFKADLQPIFAEKL